MEQQCEQYISNGSVFNELADMEAIVDLSACSKREKKEQKFMIAWMKRIKQNMPLKNMTVLSISVTIGRTVILYLLILTTFL